MELRDALCQISEIRSQMARSEVFRGYRSWTVAYSGILAIVAASFQTRFVGAEHDLGRYLTWWVGAAVLSVGVTAIEITWRIHKSRSPRARQMTRLAVEQFLPCVVVGGLLTLGIARSAPEVGWMLPALWSFIFSLGIFASYRLLPSQVCWVGLYYAVCGAGCLVWGQGPGAFSPWLMAVSFGGGQLFSAVILYWTLERGDGHAV